jgi:hypothetical protein
MSTTFVPPNVGGNTPMERFESILKRVVSGDKPAIGRKTKHRRHKKSEK